MKEIEINLKFSIEAKEKMSEEVEKNMERGLKEIISNHLGALIEELEEEANKSGCQILLDIE